jgi:hypothetical protein
MSLAGTEKVAQVYSGGDTVGGTGDITIKSGHWQGDNYVSDSQAAGTGLRNQGYDAGTYYGISGGTQSKQNSLETKGERYINQQQNYMYGGTPYGADNAVTYDRMVAGAGAGALTDRSREAVNSGAFMQDTGVSLQNQAAQFGKRATPTTNYDLAMAARADQQGAYGGLMGSAQDPRTQQDVYNSLMAAGQVPEGPSAAQAQLQQGTNQALASQLAIARSGRGAGESASALRGAAWNASDIQQNAGNQAAQLRAQEDQAFRQRQLQAFGAAGGVAGQMRGQGIEAYGAAGQLAGQERGQDVGQAEYLTDAELRNRALNDQTALGYQNTALGYQNAGLGYQQLATTATQGAGTMAMSGEEQANQIREAELQGSMGYETNLTNYAIGNKQPPKEGGMTSADWAQLGVSAAGVAAMASDIRAKQDIQALPLGAARGLAPPSRLPPVPGQQMPQGYAQPAVRPAVPGTLTAGQPQQIPPEILARRRAAQQQAAQRAAYAQSEANRGPDRVALGVPQAALDARAARAQAPAPANPYAAQGAAVGMSDIRAKQDISQLSPQAGGGLSNYQMGTARQPMQAQPMQPRQPPTLGSSQPGALNSMAAYGNYGQAPSQQPLQAQAVTNPYIQRAAGMALSDKRAKSEARQEGFEAGIALNPQPDLPVDGAAQDTIRHAPGYSYQYRDPAALGAQPGTHYGPMAQDLERTPMGRSVVSTGPDGMKRVDTNRLSLVNTAALNAQQQEIDDLKRRQGVRP